MPASNPNPTQAAVRPVMAHRRDKVSAGSLLRFVPAALASELFHVVLIGVILLLGSPPIAQTCGRSRRTSSRFRSRIRCGPSSRSVHLPEVDLAATK